MDRLEFKGFTHISAHNGHLEEKNSKVTDGSLYT